MKNKIDIFISCLFMVFIFTSNSYSSDKLIKTTNDCVDMSLDDTRWMVRQQKRQPFKTSIPLSVSEENLREMFGNFKIVFEELEDDPYSGANEESGKVKVEDWYFDGVILTVKSNYPKSLKYNNIYWIKQITIRKNIYPLRFPVTIGSTKDEMQCYLGKIPENKINSKRIIYPYIKGFSNVIGLTFYFDEKDLVEQIEFVYYLDID